MKMTEAKYNGKKISTTDMNAVDYKKIYRKNLSCISDGCEAKIVWVVGGSNKGSYFRNANYEVHSKKCPFFAEETVLADKTIIDKTVGSYSNNQIKNKHAHAIQKMRDELGLKKKRAVSEKDERPVKYEINEKKQRTSKKSQLPSDGKVISDSSGEARASASPAVMPRNITPAMLNNEITVMSNQVTVKNGELISIDDDKRPVKLIFTEAFDNNAGGKSTANELIKSLIGTINKKSTNQNFAICATGILTRATDSAFEYSLPIINPVLISINSKNPYDLIRGNEDIGGEFNE